MKTIKQLWQLVKHQKLYTLIYLLGTALALASVTVYAVQIRTKVADVYPEYQRHKTYIMERAQVVSGSSTMQSKLGYTALKDYFYGLQSAEAVCGIHKDWEDNYAQPQTDALDFTTVLIGTDTNYFDIFSLRFVAGGPFGETDLDGAVNKALLDTETASRIFGPEDPQILIGREFTVDFCKYRAAGIFEPMSPTVPVSYANIIVPYTTIDGYDDTDSMLLGRFTIVFLTDDSEALREEIDGICRNINNSQGEYEVDFLGQPVSNIALQLGDKSMEEFSMSDFVRTTIITFLVMLLIPALNLSGMVSGRMEGRLPELGVRKTYGARPATLLRALLYENLILTLVGAVFGFLGAWLLLRTSIGLETSDGEFVPASGEMVFAPTVFVLCLLVCLLLNIASALFPAWRALRRPIVESLKEK